MLEHVCHRLREIEMSEHDAEMYQRTLNKVRRQIQILRIMLDSVQVIHCIVCAHLPGYFVSALHF